MVITAVNRGGSYFSLLSSPDCLRSPSSRVAVTECHVGSGAPERLRVQSREPGWQIGFGCAVFVALSHCFVLKKYVFVGRVA